MARNDAERDGRLAAIFERLPQGIASVDASLLVATANDAFTRAVGAPSLRRGSPLPEPWESFSLRDFAALAHTAATPQEAIVAPDIVRLLSVTAIPPSTAEENVILIVTDVSDRERAERLQREFVANASHELRTPIATISGAIEILQTGAKEDPEARDRFLGHIEREVSRLGRLVHALLVLARAQAMQELPFLAPVRVRPLLEEAAASLVLAPGVEVSVTCALPLAALAEPDLLLEVVMNLASNAAKYTRAGQVELFAEDQGRAVAIEIRDTGVGIPAEEQTALFARFYRGVGRDASGFGIGLAIVREAVLVLGGGIEVQSAPGVGTTVRVTLPRADEVAA